MPHAHGKRLRLRLFLEGIEVPIISANVRSAPNSPTAASIQIPPLAEGTRFFPRTLVHLFFLDLYEQESPLIRSLPDTTTDSKSPSAQEGQQGDTESPQGIQDIQNSQYKLLFGGEVIGFQWTKNSSQRSLVLQCMDWSNYWDYAYQWSDTGIFGPGIKAVFSGGATNLFTDFLSSKGSTITAIVASGRCNSFPKLKGLAAGIIRLIEAVGGSYFPKPASDEVNAVVKKFAGQNIFFSVAELRLHITHMIAAYEDDPTSSRILKRQGYAGLFNRILGNLGGQVSIRKSINALTGVIFHETYGQPCPFYKPGLGNTINGRVTTRLEDDPDFAALVNAGAQAAQGLRDIQESLDAFANATAVVRTAAGDVKGSNLAKLTQMQRLLNQALVTARGQKAPEEVTSILSKTAHLIATILPALQRWRPDGPDALKTALTTKILAAISQLQALSSVVLQKTKPSQAEPARLNQHILRPDIWFGSPPRCNVLFPEDYDTLTYSRIFLEEPTRFMLKTNDEYFGEDFLFDKFYFAPQAGSLKKDQARLQDMLKNDLLDHELFTGILPVFEKMGEFNVFAANSGTQKSTSKVGLAQRSANFLYFKHRFAARQMQIAGKFNPYVAVGFPGLVIDRYVDAQTILTYNQLIEAQNERRGFNGADDITPSKVLGTNFLANFTEVSHSVSQAGSRGRTEINCSYARQPEESVEFLGTLDKKQSVMKKQDQSALRATDVAALTAPKLGSQGPMGGKIVNVTDVTQLYARQDGTSKPLPLFGRTSRSGGGQFKAPRVSVGVPTDASSLSSSDVSELTGGSRTPVVFRAFRVDEEVPRYSKQDVDLPAEEFIRPGWYGDIWNTTNIGKVYTDFLGIGSITDPQQVSGGTISGPPAPNEELENASADASEVQSADDPNRLAPILTALDAGASIQQAVDFLLLTYSFVRSSGADVDQFVSSYRWRPVATMVDLFGTSDLQFDTAGNVTQGIEGFHSRAFGPFEDLFGIAGPDLQDILGIKRGSTTAQRADTRKRKFQAVQEYVSALLAGRAILG